eukprot:TRINITY_DN65067_c0_g1_i1.p1 TRINITY_DN65067_c0_g1~~TRINITY_DN65067_c0_g1_i1.p1  ORF type:complete len:289 (-),score=53.61 TRINITY_DN65067_c0_g1_i1:36-902(-)
MAGNPEQSSVAMKVCESTAMQIGDLDRSHGTLLSARIHATPSPLRRSSDKAIRPSISPCREDLDNQVKDTDQPQSLSVTTLEGVSKTYPEAAKDELATRQVQEQVRHLWELASSSAQPHVLEEFRRKAAVARAAAEADFERRWHAQLWDIAAESLNQEAFGTLVSSMRASAEPLPVHIVRRIFDTQPHDELASGYVRRASSRAGDSAGPGRRRCSDPTLARQAARASSRPSLPANHSSEGRSKAFSFLPPPPRPSLPAQRGRTDESPSVRERIRHLETSQTRSQASEQ